MIIHGCHLPALARGDSRQFFTGIKWGWGRLKPKLSSCKRGNKYLVITAQSDWECQHVKQDDIMNSLTSQHFTESCNADCSSQKTVSVHWLPQSQAHMIMQQYRGRKFSLNTKIMHLRGWMIRCLPSGWGAKPDQDCKSCQISVIRARHDAPDMETLLYWPIKYFLWWELQGSFFNLRFPFIKILLSAEEKESLGRV